MKSERRDFDGHSLTEQPDGSAVLIVQTRDGKKKQTLAIHLARHVYADIAFECCQKIYNQQLKNEQALEVKRRLSA